MSKYDFAAFKEQFGVNNTFIDSISLLFDKLQENGYINFLNQNKLIDKLYDNIKEVYVGTNNSYDYKSGFYDANKQVLYIKNESDVAAIFLRILYAITTTEQNDNEYTTGYMVTKLKTDSYKMGYYNYGINRAVLSNLVCKLLDSLPTDIGMYTINKTYTQDFMGYKIESPNNIYPIEGKLLSELCFILDINEDLLFSGIFSKSPVKYLNKLLSKKGLNLENDIFKHLDNISIWYNTYNKLTYLSKKLNDNYLEFKKNILANDVSELKEERERILNQISSVISSLETEIDAQELTGDEVATSLNEKIAEFENKIINEIISYQEVLVEIALKNEILSTYQYACKLKQLDDMLLVKNEKLSKAVIDVILYQLLPKDELTTVNMTVKIKYALLQGILSDKQFSSVSKGISFCVIPELINEENGTALALLSVNNTFARLVQIEDLNAPLEKMSKYPSYIPIDNFNYILNSDFSNMYVGSLEKLYTALKNKYEDFKELTLNDLYMFEYMNSKYLIVNHKNNLSVLAVDIRKNPYYFCKLTITEPYLIFGLTPKEIKKASHLPTIYTK